MRAASATSTLAILEAAGCSNARLDRHLSLRLFNRAADAPIVMGPVPIPLREARRRWAELLRQIFEVDPLRCPECGAEMRIVPFFPARAVIDRIVDHLRRARDTARGPPRLTRRHGPRAN